MNPAKPNKHTKNNARPKDLEMNPIKPNKYNRNNAHATYLETTPENPAKNQRQNNTFSTRKGTSIPPPLHKELTLTDMANSLTDIFQLDPLPPETRLTDENQPAGKCRQQSTKTHRPAQEKPPETHRQRKVSICMEIPHRWTLIFRRMVKNDFKMPSYRYYYAILYNN